MKLDKPVGISLGFANVFLIPAAEGCVPVDTGAPGSEEEIFAGMARYGLAPSPLTRGLTSI